MWKNSYIKVLKTAKKHDMIETQCIIGILLKWKRHKKELFFWIELGGSY